MTIKNDDVLENGLEVLRATPPVRQTGKLKAGSSKHEGVDKGGVDYYAFCIGEEYQRTQESASRIGRLLIEAKESLPHGEWGKLTGETAENERGLLLFSARTAQMFMAIARSPKLRNPNHGSDLALPVS